jgi:hypothetical protein
VFSERYRQFNFAIKAGNRAVKFDNKGLYITPYVRKLPVVEPKRIVEVNALNKRVENKLKKENEMLKEKTRVFLRSIELASSK